MSFKSISHNLPFLSLSGSRCAFKPLETGQAFGFRLFADVRSLPVFLHPHRVQRIHLRQSAHLPRGMRIVPFPGPPSLTL